MTDGFVFLIFQLAVLIFSVMVHEVAHGAMALRLGDTTARDAGRLTLNPIKHLDFFGSFIVPISLYILSGGAFVLGWAKPVPINPHNLKNPKKGSGLIAAVGPLSNLAVAAVFGLLLQFVFPIIPVPSGLAASLSILLNTIVAINVILAVFNLVPLPPLDGSNLLFSLLPRRLLFVQEFLLRYGFWILILFLLFGFQLITPIIGLIYRFLVGSAALF